MLFSILGESGDGIQKRLQRVEILKIAEPCPLIDPSQVVVTQGEILVADPVLTPIGTFLYRHGHPNPDFHSTTYYESPDVVFHVCTIEVVFL